MSARLGLAAVWVDGDGRTRVGLPWKVKLLRVSSAADRGGRRDREWGWRHLRCVHSSATPLSPKPRVAAGGAQGLRCWPRPVCTRSCWWVCVRGYRASAHHSGPSSFSWMTASCKAAHYQRDRKLLLSSISWAISPCFPAWFPR